jgi:oligopeptide transport system permease protein
MLQLIVRRLIWIIPVLFVVALATFLLMHLVPGTPWDMGGPRALSGYSYTPDRATLAEWDRRYGLDKPLWRQFMAYLVGDVADGRFECGVVCGNLGPSFRQHGRSVQEVLFEPPEGMGFWQSRFGYSARLGLLALLFAVGVGLPVGIIAALRHGGWVDYLITTVTAIGTSVPNFVIGLLLIVLLASTLHWISIVPSSWAKARPSAWLVPAIVLGLGVMATVARLTRASMLEVMHQDYVRTARAKGLTERLIVSRHMLKNALIAVVTILGPALAELVTASFIIEMMFGFPGIGREYVESVTNLDYSMIMAATLLYAVLIALSNLGVDIAYGLIDPRLGSRAKGTR